MKWKMLFRIGLTVVILVAILLFYLNNVLHKDKKDRLSELVKSDNQAFQEALVRHGSQVTNGAQNQETNNIGAADAGQGPAEQLDARKVDSISGGSRNGGKGGGSLQGQGEENLPKVDNSIKDPVKTDNSDQGSPLGGDSHTDVSKSTGGLLPVHYRVGKKVDVQAHRIHLCLVACGDRAEEVLVLLKSAIIMTTSTPLVLHIFAERDLHKFFTQQLDFWPPEILERVEYRVYDITFPGGENDSEWKKLFKPCSSQRLFLPALLTDVDSLIYVDTDILFVSPLDKLWAFFKQFNSTQLVALAPEHEDPNVGWYNRFARHPFVSPLGINSGVMLMNLTRLRQSTWFSSILEYYKEYRLKITWGDQDLINIYFHYHPDQLYIYSCEWNYRPDHCMYMSVCKPAEQNGAFILHGCRRVMHNDKQPAFRAIYNAFSAYRFGEDVEFVLLERMKKNLLQTKSTQCGKVAHIFLKQMERFVAETRSHLEDGHNRPEVPVAPPGR